MKIEIKLVDYTPKLDSYNDNGYYEGCVNYLLKKCNGTLLFWLLFEEQNYFTLPIRHDLYKSCLPFVSIHRTADNYYSFEEDGVGLESILEYPYIIATLGCDDGDKGWRFKTKSEMDLWVLNMISDMINSNKKDVFRDGYEFFAYYKEHQVWSN